MNAIENYPLIIKQALNWGDMDANQHINNVVFFRYFEDARIAYFDAIGAMKVLSDSNIGPILANANCNFRAPLKYPDTIHIGTRVSDPVGKRFTMEFMVYSESQKQLVAEGEGLIVYFDYNNNHSCEIPDSMLNAINKFESK